MAEEGRTITGKKFKSGTENGTEAFFITRTALTK